MNASIDHDLTLVSFDPKRIHSFKLSWDESLSLRSWMDSHDLYSRKAYEGFTQEHASWCYWGVFRIEGGTDTIKFQIPIFNFQFYNEGEVLVDEDIAHRNKLVNFVNCYQRRSIVLHHEMEVKRRRFICAQPLRGKFLQELHYIICGECRIWYEDSVLDRREKKASNVAMSEVVTVGTISIGRRGIIVAWKNETFYDYLRTL